MQIHQIKQTSGMKLLTRIMDISNSRIIRMNKAVKWHIKRLIDTKALCNIVLSTFPEKILSAYWDTQYPGMRDINVKSVLKYNLCKNLFLKKYFNKILFVLKKIITWFFLSLCTDSVGGRHRNGLGIGSARR